MTTTYCERHGRARCKDCGVEPKERQHGVLWHVLEGLGELVQAVLEGLSSADWEDD